MTQKPFMEQDGNDHIRLNTARIIEAIMIGAVVGLLSTGITAFVTLQLVGAKVEQLTSETKHLIAKTEADRQLLTQLQVTSVTTQARLAEVQSSMDNRIKMIEKKVFNLP